MPQRESVRLFDAYWRTQARTGATVAARALAEWSRVSPTSLVTSGRAWLAFVLALLGRERVRSREAAASFYRLYRAVETGATLPPVSGTADGPVTLGELRDDWAQFAGTPRAPQSSDEELVPVDDFDWPEPDEAAQDAAARTALAVTGPARVREAIDQASNLTERGRLDSADFLNELDEVMRDAGVNAAGAADREALRGGRELIRDASRADRRVIGWARVTDGSPCAFCAMLASRGAVYRSEAGAFFEGRGRATEIPRDPDALAELEQYHNGCHCQAVPVYSRADFLTPQARQYAQEWAEVTRGLAGADARREWRRHIDAQRRSS
ncbi:hypothetical protein RM844_17025 [Streptomyces sp. DSM 44915]|uniref:Capsid maturation protease n=1 Tax=Streptomyces chisholmiae TaxID=3075540 RepID=A0ABU2JSL9_9ACTN|nr:hypothetical protein [Streptomyces sp. DSM 44915]MDT0267985.1 hypothetical protein [Streptomyces sp. DSM 44915]